jgi:hypothetical protein
VTIANGITAEEKVRARAHLGYLNAAAASTFVLGAPAALETTFLVEGAWEKVLLEAVPLFRRYLAALDAIEEEMLAGLPALQARRVGQIEIADDHMKKLAEQYELWRAKLANLLGVPANPFDRTQGSGINAPVIHR